MNVVEKIHRIEGQMNANYIERKGEIRAILLGVLAQKNVLFIGNPGVAKSSVIDQFMRSFEGDIQTFTRLISPTTQPEELFGSAKFDRLKDGVIERNVENQLPVAHFAFLDEIFKSTSDLLNGLLKIMNEHTFENGGKQIKSPLFTLIGASNEFPEEDNLSALYDRFLIRREVEAIKTPEKLIEMLIGNTSKVEVEKLSLKEISEAQQLVLDVEIPLHIITKMAEIHFKLKDSGVLVSDRRTKHCLTILKANAYLNMRSQVIESDFHAIEDCLWNEADERSTVRDILIEYTKTEVQQILEKTSKLYNRIEARKYMREQRNDSVNYVEQANFGSDLLLQLTELNTRFDELNKTQVEQKEMSEIIAKIHTLLAEEVL